MNRSLTVSDAPRARAFACPSARDWAFVLVVLTVWTSVAPVAYIFQIGSFGIVPYEIFEALAIFVCGLLCIRGEMRIVLPAGVWWLIAYMALTTASAWLAVDARAAFVQLSRFWLSWLVMFLVPMVVTDRRLLGWFLAAMLVQAFVLVALTLGAQLDALGLPSLPPVLLPEFHKNEYGTYLAFAIALGLVAWNTDLLPPRVRRVAMLIPSLAIISWPLTYSRSGLLAIVCTLMLLMFLERRRVVVRQGVALVVLGVVAWAILPGSARENSTRAVRSLANVFQSNQSHTGAPAQDPFQRTVDERLVLDRAAIAAIAAHPLAGLGLTRWQAQSPVTTPVWDLKRSEVVVVGAAVHNQYLYIAAESGLPTLVAYLACLYVLLRRALIARRWADETMRFFLAALVACTVSLLLALLVMPGTLWEWNQLALLAVVERLTRGDAEPATRVRAA